MTRHNRSTLHMALTAAVVVASLTTLTGQAPLPLQGRRGQGPGQGRQGQVPPPNLPPSPIVSPLAMVSAEVTGPGKMFPALMSLPKGEDLASHGYEVKEYFVTGTANGQPYKTRIVVRRPSNNSRFSGLVLAESMHPSGNAWMFHFTHTYTMSSGHVGLEIVTSDPAQFVEYNEERYKDLKVLPGQASEIIAQVGALVKSRQTTSPLASLRLRKMVLAGTSASAGVLIQYLPAHMVFRLADMKPIYDGFLPTSNGANIQQIDVPMIQVPTTTEAMRGTVPTRQDGDTPGDQFRVYEFAGMAHLDTRDVEAFRPNPCKYPVSMFPMSAYMSVALHHLFQWIDKGTVPPRADRILLDRNTANDGSLMALDELGNPRGGIRNPYVDVPIVTYGVPNVGATPPTPNTVPWVALRGEAGINQLCGLTGYQTPLTQAQLKKLYKDERDYQSKVRRTVDELTRQGWSLPVYRDQILAETARVNFAAASSQTTAASQRLGLPQGIRDVTVTAIPGVVDAGAKWTLVWQGVDNADGIVGTTDGGILFAQEQPNRISKLDRHDRVSVYLEDTHGTGALAIDAGRRVLAVQRTCTDPGRQPAQCTEPTMIGVLSPERKVLANSFEGKPLGRLNDLVADRKGGVYFTVGGAYYVSSAGEVTSLGDNIRSNGIMLSPDEKTVYVTNGDLILAFDVQTDGTVTNRRDFGKLEAGGNGDGMAIDAAGRLYVTSGPGVQVLGPNGKYLGVIPTPRSVISVAFSGSDKKTLYVVGSGALGPDGKEFTTAAGVRNNAKTIYKLPMLASGFKGRAK